MEDGEEEEDCKEVEEDGWFHCYQGGSISEAKKRLFKKISEKREILFKICLRKNQVNTSLRMSDIEMK